MASFLGPQLEVADPGAQPTFVGLVVDRKPDLLRPGQLSVPGHCNLTSRFAVPRRVANVFLPSTLSLRIAWRYSSLVAAAGRTASRSCSSANMIVRLVCTPRGPLRNPKHSGNP
jgi:hypothetical protein